MSFAKTSLGLLLLCGFLQCTAAQTSARAVVEGSVRDAGGAAMPFVNVQLVGTTDGAATDLDGRFRFTTTRQGKHTVQASMIGFEPAGRSLILAPGETVRIELVLKETLLTLNEAVVTASAYTTGEAETVTLQPLEVVTTPGAAADIFRAIQTFPGVTAIDDGAGLFVRGGDVSETVTLLDQATVVHPYKYESPTGGVFGTIPPFLVSGTYFSSGGFSVRYGNALSAVLAMQSLDLPLQQTYTLNLGLAAASLGADVPIIPGKLGVRVSGNRSFTGLLFRINGQRDEFTTVPQSLDGNLSLIYRYSPTGRVTFFNYVATDRLGVQVDQPSFAGVYRGETMNQLHNLQWQEAFGAWFMRTSLSANRYASRRRLGNLDLRPGDRTYKLRTDWEYERSDDTRLAVGGEVERSDNLYRGTLPMQEDILDPEAATYTLDEHFDATRAGAYAEVEWQPWRRVVTTFGVRADYHTLAQQVVVDPRVSAQYAFSKHTRARLAGGIYHQFPDPFDYNVESGNLNLSAQEAIHLVAGIHHEQDLLMVRTEAYLKPYRRLVIRTEDDRPANIGDGSARGVDVFVKYGAFLRTRFSGWLSYSFLQAHRLQARHVGSRIVHERGPAPFDVTHNLSLIGKARVVGFLSTGLRLRYATGHPVTPIIDAVPVEGGEYYLPVEGAVGSERVPSFIKMDAQISYYLPLSWGTATVYAALSNVLNRANVLGYDYTADYTQRTERLSNYRRSVYFGVTLTLNP